MLHVSVKTFGYSLLWIAIECLSSEISILVYWNMNIKALSVLETDACSWSFCDKLCGGNCCICIFNSFLIYFFLFIDGLWTVSPFPFERTKEIWICNLWCKLERELLGHPNRHAGTMEILDRWRSSQNFEALICLAQWMTTGEDVCLLPKDGQNTK